MRDVRRTTTETDGATAAKDERSAPEARPDETEDTTEGPRERLLTAASRLFALRGYGGDASGHARFDFPDVNRPQITLEARLDSARADAVLLAWTGAGKLLRGSLGATIKLGTSAGEHTDA